MKMEVERVWKVHVSIHKCKRAKRIITQELDGSYHDEYTKLDAFCEELRASNTGTDAWTEVSREESQEEGKKKKKGCSSACISATMQARLVLYLFYTFNALSRTCVVPIYAMNS